jgi:hypothetical protein
MYETVREFYIMQGYEVFDFKLNTAFYWSEKDYISPAIFIDTLDTSSGAEANFTYDKSGLDWCDTCVLLLPCGNSAHLEAGYAVGQGKKTIIVTDVYPHVIPELMYKFATKVVVDFTEALGYLEK